MAESVNDACVSNQEWRSFDKFVCLDHFQRCTEVEGSGAFTTGVCESDGIIIVAFGSFSQPRRCHLDMMQSAREHFAWQGLRVIRGMLVPHVDDSFLTLADRERLLRVAVEEEREDNAWLTCYGSDMNEDEVTNGAAAVMKDLREVYPGSCILCVAGCDIIYVYVAPGITSDNRSSL